MSDSCSAVPADLEAYGAAGLRMDALLRAQSERLQDAINKLMASHPDPSVLGRVQPVGSNLNHYATTNANADVWVGDVGQAFRRANKGGNPAQVQHASSKAIDGYLKKEEPHGPDGAEILAKLDPKAKGSIVTNYHSVADWLVANQGWLASSWSFFAMGGQLPVLLASFAKGYKLQVSGNYVIAKGSRFLGDDTSFIERYIQSGRLRGVRYAASTEDVAKFYKPLTAIRGDLRAAFNPADADFLKAVPKGGGAAAALLTIGGDVYDYTAGSHKKMGLLSNDFAASTTVDLATTGASIAAGAAASAGSGALMGATIGSVVPGVGTVVGIGVGVGIGLLMNTSWGKSARNTAVHAVSTGYRDAEHWGSEAVHDVGSAAKSVGNFLGL